MESQCKENIIQTELLADSINIYSDNSYAIKTLTHLIKKHCTGFPMKHSVSFFIFIKEWLTPEGFNALLHHRSDKVLIIASASICSFLEKNISMKNINYFSCFASVEKTEKKVKNFLNSPLSLKNDKYITHAFLLTETEKNVISLYLSGWKPSAIAKTLTITSFLVYKHRMNVMIKKGFINNLSLIRHWNLL